MYVSTRAGTVRTVRRPLSTRVDPVRTVRGGPGTWVSTRAGTESCESLETLEATSSMAENTRYTRPGWGGAGAWVWVWG